MIPHLLLAGIVAAALINDLPSLKRFAWIGALLSLMWGVLIGVLTTSLEMFAGGTGVAVANILVGGLVGAPIGLAARSFSERKASTSRA